MKLLITAIALPLLAAAQIAADADDARAKGHDRADDRAQAEYTVGPIECRVIEVSIQEESGSFRTGFHCIETPLDPANMDGRIFELEELPPVFESSYRDEDSPEGVLLRARNIYRTPSKIIFTRDTTWSISAIEK